jgi:hypothetical protein
VGSALDEQLAKRAVVDVKCPGIRPHSQPPLSAIGRLA